MAQGGVLPDGGKGLTFGDEDGIINTDWQGEPTKRDVKLSDEAKSYDEQLQKKSDYITGKSGAFREDDVRWLSAKNGVEYACLTIGDESVLIRGDSGSTSISDEFFDRLVKNGGTFDYHTHPYDGDIIPSQSDMALMGKLSGLTGQETSKIISTDGLYSTYTEYGIVETGTVTREIDDDYAEFLSMLFS
ncbi:MAG: hypothetical protein LUF89_08405 [Ruminococcus sp.]|nr:hypothetical protein [Ruminococcus sp.]